MTATPLRCDTVVCRELLVGPGRTASCQPSLLPTVGEGGYASFTSVDGRGGVQASFVPSPSLDQLWAEIISCAGCDGSYAGERKSRKGTQSYAKDSLVTLGVTAATMGTIPCQFVAVSKFPENKESDFVGRLTAHPKPRPLPLGRGKGVVGRSGRLRSKSLIHFTVTPQYLNTVIPGPPHA